MPEIYSMSRWNTSGEYGEPAMQGDKVVHSVKKAKPKDHIKGCPGNNGKEHFYVATKIIHHYTKPAYQFVPGDNIRYDVHCLFCDKKGWMRSSWVSGTYVQKLPKGAEVDKTVYRVYGDYVRNSQDWRKSGYRIISEKTYDGDVDSFGKPVV